MHAKFPEDQKSILTSSIKCLNFKILKSKIMYKNYIYEPNSK